MRHSDKSSQIVSPSISANMILDVFSFSRSVSRGKSEFKRKKVLNKKPFTVKIILKFPSFREVFNFKIMGKKTAQLILQLSQLTAWNKSWHIIILFSLTKGMVCTVLLPILFNNTVLSHLHYLLLIYWSDYMTSTQKFCIPSWNYLE